MHPKRAGNPVGLKSPREEHFFMVITTCFPRSCTARDHGASNHSEVFGFLTSEACLGGACKMGRGRAEACSQHQLLKGDLGKNWCE